jgi:O-antigen/teichoic acid export membrane protein
MLPEPLRQFVEDAQRDPLGFVGFGILVILVGVNWIVYRAWWASQATKTWPFSKRFLIVMFVATGGAAIMMGLAFILVPWLVN